MDNWLFMRVPRQFHGEKSSLSTNGAGEYPYEKKNEVGLLSYTTQELIQNGSKT